MIRQERIKTLLSSQLNPTYLLIEDESSLHRARPQSETHLKLTAVSSAFESLTRLARHRLVNTLVDQEFHQGLHALSLHLYTPTEWKNKITSPPASPVCQSKSLN